MNKRYKYINMPNHPRAKSDGCVYEHILVAEKMLGRHLKSEEVVHHIDEDKCNNSPENLMVFATLADHTRFHKLNNNNRKLYCINNVWYCEMILPKCKICNKEFKPTHHRQTQPQIYCSKECSQYAQRKVINRPSKAQLQELLKTNSCVAVGKMFGVSDKTIVHWLK